MFLVGEAFEEKWNEQSLRVLCASGRRVFAGNNLFAKGACFRAAQEAGLTGERTYVFLGEDKISYNVGLRTPGSGRNAVYTLLEAGESWYEAKAECQALLCGEPVVEFILSPAGRRYAEGEPAAGRPAGQAPRALPDSAIG